MYIIIVKLDYQLLDIVFKIHRKNLMQRSMKVVDTTTGSYLIRLDITRRVPRVIYAHILHRQLLGSYA